MATCHYTNLISQLEQVKQYRAYNSEGAKFTGMVEAVDRVKFSGLSESEKHYVEVVIREASNPSGWYNSCTGIPAGIEAVKALMNNKESSGSTENTTEANISPSERLSDKTGVNALVKKNGDDRDSINFNRRNLKNLVSDGSIFSVEFIKRTDGQLRKMVCRLGVKKHLKGGTKKYSTKAHNLLCVFDMENKGYRSIPVDAVQRICVNGQTFSFGG